VRLNRSAEKVALELVIFPTPTSPAHVPRATAVDFVCALFPFVFELAQKLEPAKQIWFVSCLAAEEKETDERRGNIL
jgi:hypothetical protein